MAVRQGSAEWLAARRDLVTATDIPVLLGISPYKCEADLADEKRGTVQPGATLRMRAGSALQPLIGEAYTEATGKRVRAWPNLAIHPSIEWAGASPDFRVIGEKRLVEAKRSGSRGRFADGLPQDIEAQVMWQLGVTGYPVADVAVLLGDDDLVTFEVQSNAATFDNLVAVAQDFRKRLLFGGPFARNDARIRRDHPSDDGSEIEADADLQAAALALFDVRANIERLETTEKALKVALTDRMGDAAYLRGQGWHATWKRSKDAVTVDWEALSQSLLRQIPEGDREPLIGLHSGVRQGIRPFRLVVDKE